MSPAKKKETTTALAVVSKETLNELDTIAKDYMVARANPGNVFTLAMLTADAMTQMRELITHEMMTGVMGLMNTQLGFRTDKQGGSKYHIDVVKDAWIEATLMGLGAVGNQFNIIAGNMYVTKNGFSHLLRNINGLTCLKLMIEPPTWADKNDKTAIVHCSATWKFHDKTDALNADIPIRVNNGMGVDAILGKAERKFKCRIYNQIMMTDISDGDAGENRKDIIDIQAEVSDAEPQKSDAQKALEASQEEAPPPEQKPETTEARAEEQPTPEEEKVQEQVEEKISEEEAEGKARLIQTLTELRKYRGVAFKKYLKQIEVDENTPLEEFKTSELTDMYEALKTS